MRDTLNYKGFIGSVEYSSEDNCYFGKILEINDLFLYEGADSTKLETAFREAVDEYLEVHSH